VEALLSHDEARASLAAFATANDDGLLPRAAAAAATATQALLSHDEGRAALAAAAAAGDDRLLNRAVRRGNTLFETNDRKLHEKNSEKTEKK
jgi:hypothetical protein